MIADLLGKAGHIRTVPIPGWVKTAVEKWMEASRIIDGALFRSIDKTGRVWGSGMTPKVLWEIVKAAAARADIPQSLPLMIRVAPAPGFATLLAESWTRFNSCSDMFPSRPQGTIRDASRNCTMQSITSWALNLEREKSGDNPPRRD